MSKKIRVLVVDDSALMRKLIPQVLQRDPSIEVVGTAMDGAIGLKKIDELHPHVVTLDIDMPRMDGIEMLRQITRKHRVPVIVVSAQTDASASITLRALAFGAFDFVTKPQDAAIGPARSNRHGTGAENQSSGGFGSPEDDHHRPHDQIEDAAAHHHALRPFASSSRSAFPPAVPTRSSMFSRRLPAEFSGVHRRGAAHARRLYRDVRQAPG